MISSDNDRGWFAGNAMTSDIVIRDYQPADQEQVAKLMQEVWGEDRADGGIPIRDELELEMSL